MCYTFSQQVDGIACRKRKTYTSLITIQRGRIVFGNKKTVHVVYYFLSE